MERYYGSLREYKRQLARMEKRINPSEKEFMELALNRTDITIYHRGYPDFMIMRDSKIIGFVEVKPNKKSRLRPGQEFFKEFCDRNNIPFFQWSPADKFPEIPNEALAT